MIYLGTQTIETPRLRLRQLRMGDEEAMFQNWANDPEVTRYLRWAPHKTVEESRSWIAENVAGYETDPTFYNWGIERRSDGTLIGSIGALPANDAKTEWEPGYCLGRAFWGQGYMTEALRAVVAFLHDEGGVERLRCKHAVDNPASGRVMQKAGFVFDHMDSYDTFDGATHFECRVYKLAF